MKTWSRTQAFAEITALFVLGLAFGYFVASAGSWPALAAAATGVLGCW